MSTIYENISALCEKHGVSGAAMCREVGVGKSLLTSLKSGRTSSINSTTAKKIADYFGVSVDVIFGEESYLSEEDSKIICKNIYDACQGDFDRLRPLVVPGDVRVAIAAGEYTFTLATMQQFADAVDRQLHQILQKKEPTVIDDGLSEPVRKLVEFARTVPESQAEAMLQVLQTLRAQFAKQEAAQKAD